MQIRKLQNLSRKTIFLYTLFAILQFFLMGEQLHLKDTRTPILPLSPQGETTELRTSTVIQQDFTPKMDVITSFSVIWGTYYRENQGTAKVLLINPQNQEVLFSSTISMTELIEGESYHFPLNTPLVVTNIHQLTLTIQGIGEISSGATPLMHENPQETTDVWGTLKVDNIPRHGVLCFSVEGLDYTWIGGYYWYFALLLGLLLFLYLTHQLQAAQQGKPYTLGNVIYFVEKYEFLVRQLVARDFRGKYKRSLLGIFWSFLNPLLTMTVQYIVFSELFRFDIPNYPVYLICGIILFSFFNESCGMTLMSIVGNSSLITKVYVPKMIYPFTRTLSSLLNLLISLCPLLLVALFSGILPTKAYLLLPFPLLCLTLFSFGIGLILSTAMVFFRDTQFLWGIFSMIWMYLTPVFYPPDILPHHLNWILQVNPLYYFVSFTRTLVMEGISPEPFAYVQCILAAIIPFFLGIYIFRKQEDHFVLYI